MRLPSFVLTVLIALWPALALATAEDPEELARTWQAAWVYLPDDTAEGAQRVSMAQLPALLAERDAPLPVVIYAHGCSGHYNATNVVGRFLASNGYLFIGPDSFARQDKPTSCVPENRVGGLHRAVLGWRQAEIRHALDEARALPSVAEDALFLMGFSEGGIATATFAGAPLAGRIVEGWTCHAGWGEYRGLRAPADEPLLALVAKDDPWFRLPVLRGDCGAFMAGRSDSLSVVVTAPPALARSHWVSKDAGIQRQILEFLAAARN